MYIEGTGATTCLLRWAGRNAATCTNMADIKFACPHCSQHITCDELWGGHQLECPSCKNAIGVPAAPTPAATGPAGLVPKPPVAAEARLAINPAHAAQATAGGPPQKAIPIRNLAPAAPKKKSPLVAYGVPAAVVLILGVGGYYGYGFYMQNKAATPSNEVSKNTDGGQLRRSGVSQEQPVVAEGASASTNTDSEPLIPALWTLDLSKARIPSGRANGTWGGTNFVPQIARVDPVGNAQVLRLLQGQPTSPDREVLIYLHLKAGEKLGGQNLNVSPDMAGAGVPQVTKRWKTNPKYAPQYKSFTSGYAMKLELGPMADGAVPGKIFLALPDPEQSVVAGNFKASIITNVVTDATVQATPVMAPATPSSADAAFQARYGIRRGQ